MSAKNYLKILRGGIIASLLVVFFVFSNLLFPYITSKQLVFNILMEILFVIYLVFILRYPQYRPKKSYLTWGLLAYFAVILITSFTGVNFVLSFWGNAERMLGFFDLFHFLIFYFILITAFRSWKDWRNLFMSSVIIAVLVSLRFLTINSVFPFLVFKHLDVYSTIGNTAYVSGYLIFNIFFSFILWLRSEQKGWRWLYGLGIIIMLLEFWHCHTSGAIIGLFISILFLFLLLGLSHKRKVLRRTSLALLVVSIIAVVGIFSQYKAPWFQHSFLRNLTPEKTTFQTRLISWKSAAKDFQYHPFLGVGLGNYAIIFDKHFSSNFFNYATSGTYFDRAHNNLIDITSTTGLLGLVTYLSIFVFLIYYLLKKFKRNGSNAGMSDDPSRHNLEIIIILSLITAYFIQNLAVFDSLVTYMGLMMTIAFVYYLVTDQHQYQTAGELQAPKEVLEEELKASELKKPWALSPKREWLVLIILVLGGYIFISAYSLRPWRMFKGSIKAYGEILNNNFTQGFATYRQSLVDTPLDHDARVTLINLAISNSQIFDSFDNSEEKAKNIDYVISLAKKNLANNPLDSLGQMQLAQVLNLAALANRQDASKYQDYSQRAFQAIDKSIAASPGRAPIYLIKARMLLMNKESEKAIETTKYAISLNPNYYAGYCRLALFSDFLKNTKDFGPAMTACLDKGGVRSLASDKFLINSLNYYAEQDDYRHSLVLAERLAALHHGDAKVLINLAKLYAINGDISKAQISAQQAISLDKTLLPAWKDFEKLIINSQLTASSSSSTSSQAK